jgi:hypothetical protein
MSSANKTRLHEASAPSAAPAGTTADATADANASPNANADFCIFSSPGAGGSLLVEELDAHPELVCHGELFHQKRLPLAMNVKLLLQRDYDSKRLHDPYGFLADLRRASRSVYPQKPLMGFEVRSAHGDRVWRRFAAEAAWRKVLVQRSNKLAQYARAMRGLGRASGAGAGTIHVKSGKDGQRPPFGAQEFERWLGNLQRYEAALAGDGGDSSGAAHLITITHEELLRGDLRRELLLHLGAGTIDLPPPAPPTPRQALDVAERFADAEAVRMAMRQRGSEHWLHEA